MKRITIISTLILLVLILGGCMPPGEPLVIEETVNIADTKRIDIDLSSSDLEVIVENRDDVFIEYLTYENGPDLRVREGASLRISEESDWPFMIGYNRSPRLNVYVPTTFKDELIIETSSGDVDIRDMTLNFLDVNMSSGDFYGEDLKVEEVKINLSSGDVLIETLVADTIDLDSSSGETELYNVEGKIKGHASSGDVIIELETLVDDIDYRLSSGEIFLRFLDSDIDAELDLSCSSGDVRNRLRDVDIDKEDDNLLRGTIGSGKFSIELHTSSGDITVED